MHENSMFLTLTYIDETLPHCVEGYETLLKSDLQDFWRKLRKNLKIKIRYYACGEYGDLSGRPHYHAIVFGWWPDDAQYYKESKGVSGNKLFISKTIDDLWSKGICAFSQVTKDTIAYCSKYITQKVTGVDADMHYIGREPEFSVMSRRPGIASEWFDKYKDQLMSQGNVTLGENIMSMPRYYKQKLKPLDPYRKVDGVWVGEKKNMKKVYVGDHDHYLKIKKLNQKRLDLYNKTEL